MRPVRIGRLARNDNVKTVGESVLRRGADADIGLDAGDDDAGDLLLMQEQRKIGGEESAVAPFGGDDLARARRLKAGKERSIGIADEMMARQLPPLVILEAGIVLFDGVNEKGLATGTFYFPTSAGYMPYAPSDAGKTIAQWEVGSYILENFASVDEVRASIGNVVVPSVVFAGWGFAPEAHYIVHDPTGKSIVIEYVDGKLNIHDDPLGVITNSPNFDWHMTNLRNYVNFSMTNVPPIKLGTVVLKPFGQGTGMLGMPGDFTPPSRFVRAVAFSQSVLPSKTGHDAIIEAFHILNQFDIPKGSAREHAKDEHGNVVADYTLWTSAIDLKAKQYFFRTYDNSEIRMIDLMKMNLDAKDIVKISIEGDERIRPINP